MTALLGGKVDAGEPRRSDEHDDYVWHDLAGPAPTPLTPATARHLGALAG